ncbi:hypothetical protein MTER_21130 [Mycolicibacter terrae]|uniref:DUF2834 domain-containing protein n=1 Tax=Mycolicibacter terrae TaxID=1788 RepID=A0AAD1HW76_9MYCO|nr:DUF2834 domain-containing protein [Mycolicibacter terrae]ORW97540.1 hypothetical protein AWC28_09210 [Mycolicibacter terrae]BBX22702.1 hypothetical protein MTER_21130 [Mycolicibacter terrae]SNV72626.1 Protein of uncharacterised function (DUF2834) [Mycolicibacter terrae]
MDTAVKIRCSVYAAIAAVAFVATWSQNLAYQVTALDFFSSFWRETRLTPASRSVTIDILMFGLAAAVLMVSEARKHGVRLVWAYIVGGLFVGISVTFPLFLIARQLRLNSSETPKLPAKDIVLLTVVAVTVLIAVVWIGAG